MRPSSLGGAAYCVALCLSVCLSVCPSVWPSVPLSLPSVTSRHLANYNDTHVLFGRGPHIVRPSRSHKFLFCKKWTRYGQNVSVGPAARRTRWNVSGVCGDARLAGTGSAMCSLTHVRCSRIMYAASWRRRLSTVSSCRDCSSQLPASALHARTCNPQLWRQIWHDVQSLFYICAEKLTA